MASDNNDDDFDLGGGLENTPESQKEKKKDPAAGPEDEGDNDISPLAAMAAKETEEGEGGAADADELSFSEDIDESDDDMVSFSAVAKDDDFDDLDDDSSLDFPDIDEESLTPKKSGGIKKVMAPLIVLLLAGGVGAYIVMNPQILGGTPASKPVSVPAQTASRGYTPPPAQPQAAASIPVQPKTPPPPAQPAPSSMPAPEPEIAVIEPPQPEPEIAAAEPRPPEQMAEFISESDIGDDIEQFEEIQGIAQVPEIKEVPEVGPDESMADSLIEEIEEADLALDESELIAPDEAEFDVPEIDMGEAQASEDMTKEEGAELARDDSDSGSTEGAISDSVMEEPASGDQLEDNMVASESEEQDYIAEIDAPEEPQAAEQSSASTYRGSDNVYFDAASRVPSGELASEIGPRKVDPVVEPAQKFVVVEKNYDAEDPEALIVSANRALKLQRYEAAYDMFASLHEKNDRDPRILMGLAVSQQNTGRVDSAIMTYEKILDLNPDNYDAMVNMLGLIRKQYPSVALRRLINLHEKYPGHAGIAAQIGVTQAGLGQFEDAMRFLQIAASLEPNNAQHTFNMAIIADRQGNVSDAVRLYQQALEQDTVYGRGRTLPRDSIYDRLAVLRQ
jgi:hypothetical protein